MTPPRRRRRRVRLAGSARRARGAVSLLRARCAVAMLWAVLAGCGSKALEAAPERERSSPVDREAPAPTRAVAPIAAGALCVTKGAASLGARVDAPTLRAYARGASGDAASLTFRFHGDAPRPRALASGDTRRQLGLKLRAQDSCNVLYVMWRLDPRPALDVSLKRNPGRSSHRQCGADGYTKLRPRARLPVPALLAGSQHVLRAELAGDELLVWLDDALLWRGPLPAEARSLSGPAGLRSDNVSFDLVAFAAPAAAPAPAPSPSPASAPAPAPAPASNAGAPRAAVSPASPASLAAPASPACVTDSDD